MLGSMYPKALAEALDAQVVLGEAIEEADLTLASRCEGWRVRDVLNHSIAVTLKFTAFARGETDTPRTPEGDHLGDDHRSTLRSVAMAAQDAWHNVDLDSVCNLPFGSYPAPTAAGINLFYVLAHSWDIAGPTGNPFSVPDHLWQAGLRAARFVIGADRNSDPYGSPLVVDAASPVEAFLAFLGRADPPLDRTHTAAHLSGPGD